MKQLSLAIIVSILCSFVTVKTLDAFSQKDNSQRRGAGAGSAQQGHSHSHAGNGQSRRGGGQGGHQQTGHQHGGHQHEGRRQGRAGHSHGGRAERTFAFSHLSFDDVESLLQQLTPKLALSEQQQHSIRSAIAGQLQAAKQARKNTQQLQIKMLGLDLLDQGYTQRLTSLKQQANQAYRNHLSALASARESLYAQLNATQQAILTNIETTEI